jgi:hypothetical protein
MSKNQKNRSGTDILADVVAYAYETDVLPTDKEAKDYLAANNIDNTELVNWGLEKLRAVKARQKLKAAAEAHEKFTTRFEAIKARAAGDLSDLRQRVMEKLQVLASSSPESAMVYCRKFEDTPEEDLLDLEAEIVMLDEWEDVPEK